MGGRAGRADVPPLRCPYATASWRSFADEDEAIRYAVANQVKRCNLSDAELTAVVMAIDKRKARGGDRKSKAVKSNPRRGWY